ncbi:hypothetical protein pb186bvf_011657 [Paramecium bursaria]
MNYNEFDEFRSRKLAFQIHKKRLIQARPASYQLDDIYNIVNQWRTESNTRKRQETEQKISIENQFIRNRLINIQNRGLEFQIRKLSPSKKQYQLLCNQQEKLQENVKLMNRIINVSPTIKNENLSKSYQWHVEKSQQMQRYKKTGDGVQRKQ